MGIDCGAWIFRSLKWSFELLTARSCILIIPFVRIEIQDSCTLSPCITNIFLDRDIYFFIWSVQMIKIMRWLRKWWHCSYFISIVSIIMVYTFIVMIEIKRIKHDLALGWVIDLWSVFWFDYVKVTKQVVSIGDALLESLSFLCFACSNKLGDMKICEFIQ